MNNKSTLPGNVAFMAINSPGVGAINNTSYGSDVSIAFIDSPNATMEGNVHYDASVVTLFDNLESTIKDKKVGVSQDKIDSLIQEVQEMRKNYGTPSFKEKYTSFMSSVSDHVTILAALAPLIPSLTAML
ncbi:hypothetical protein [Tatumella ptyseos]|uniref:hypothetical protein n=1 Tax=Tatumella ptyseos TaxID=82987 RepID=UPI0023F121A7|nr:hypothetical protein [Tatumella ptyseos]